MDPFAGKPSKEQLENYFKMSKPYFDQIAKQYYETDRAYYDKMIAPFYGAFSSLKSVNPGAGKRVASVAVAAFLLIFAMGIGVFLLTTVSSSSDDNAESDHIEQVEPIEKAPNTNYDEGVLYFNQKEYERAELYFKKVGKSDDNYDSAQKYLQEIKVLKEELQKDKKQGTNKRNTRAPKTYSPK